MGMTDTNKTDLAKTIDYTVEACLLICHSRESGNPFLLKNSFYITFLKTIMLETILILNMDSHFHGNDRHKQRHWLYFIKQAKPVPFSWE
jgi:hypothetical protein